MTLSTAKKAELFDRLAAAYAQPSFGALPKREIDLLVFSLLYEVGFFGNSPGMQAISRQLRIPISKAKALFYEMQLRDKACDESWFHDAFLRTLKTSRVFIEKSASRDAGRIELGVENPLLRSELESRIKKLQGYPDYSFNREILKIDFESFSALMSQVAKDQKQDIEAAIIAALKSKNSKQPKLLSWQELMNEFLKAVAKESGKQVADLSLGMLTGGVSSITQAVNHLLNIT